MGTVNRLVAARAPAGAPGEERAMIAPADKDLAGLGLLLEVAFQAKILVPLREHLVIDCAVRIVAGGATFANRFVFEDVRPALGGVAFRAGVRVGGHGERPAGCGLAFVRIVAIAAAHFSIAERV